MTTIVDRARATARSAFDWIASVAVEVDGRPAWTEYGEVDDSLYSGATGVLLACAEAAASGLAVDDLARSAHGGVRQFVRDGNPRLMPDDGLFTGWAGAAAALRAWGATTGDDDALASSRQVVDALAARASTPPADGCTDIIGGDAGILVALVTGGAGDDAVADVADRLVAAAEEGPDGPQWRMVPGYQILMPNFSHGTAGVAYALALAGHRLDRPDLLEVAVRGAETLVAIGRGPTGWAAPMSVPRQSHRPAVSFGWCHGPSGTIKLFQLLAVLQPGDRRWSETVAQCYDAVRHSGLPVRHTPGFWDNVARCCGTAGVGSMVPDHYQATRDPAVLAWADELATDVLDRAVVDASGVRWSNHEHTVEPPDLTPEPGFMQGAAGIAGWLARLAAVHDDPAGRTVDLGVPVRWV